MRFTVTVDDGAPIDFECGDTLTSRWVCGEILEGKTYPYLPFLDDVTMIVDAGANCGATTAYFARHYPHATIHSFEPGSEARAILERNTAAEPNVEVHPFGLHSRDQTVPLYRRALDTGFSSVFSRSAIDESEVVELKAAGPWMLANGIDRIDVLKVDVEGCEVEVLQSLSGLLTTVKALYVEYDSRQARRDIEALLEPTHDLYKGLVFLDQGECIYVRKDYAQQEAATEALRDIIRAHWTAHGRRS